MNNQQGDKRYARLTSFYTSAFLFAKNQTLVNIEKITDSRRAQFVFLDSPELQTLLQSFNYAGDNSPEVLVDARKFVMAIKMLKDKLYQENI